MCLQSHRARRRPLLESQPGYTAWLSVAWGCVWLGIGSSTDPKLAPTKAPESKGPWEALVNLAAIKLSSRVPATQRILEALTDD